MDQQQMIDAAASELTLGLDGAAQYIYDWVTSHPDAALATLCKKVAETAGLPESWKAIEGRVTRKRQKASNQAGSGTSRRQDNRGKRAAKQALRETPEVVAELTPDEQRKLAQKLDEEAAKREHTRKQEAKQKEREHLGDETVDDLELREELQSVEYLLITARGNLRGFVKRAGELGVENTPEKWRESCLDWIEDLEGHLGMAKALLDGNNIDWAAFDALLAKE